jgi:Mrp family chromosome partitioning ATPase
MKGGIPLGTVAEITGPSGVGKTRLVHHIAAANAVAATLNQEDMDASIPGWDNDSHSSRVLIVDADTTSPNQASSLLTMVQFMVIDRSDQPDHHTAQAIKAIHIMDIREGGNTVKHSTTPHKQTMGAFIKSLYRHLTVHRRGIGL